MSPPAVPNSMSLDKPTFYQDLFKQVESILDPSLPMVANLANVSAVLYYAFNDPPVSRKVNWCGFYLTMRKDPNGSNEETSNLRLVLGPFQGRVACTLIPFGRGVCGTSASQKKTQLVKNVHDFPGHIACDSASESEIVVPIVVNGAVMGVLDIDCLVENGFDEVDQAELEKIVQESFLYQLKVNNAAARNHLRASCSRPTGNDKVKKQSGIYLLQYYDTEKSTKMIQKE
ncbi:hypothetical protein HDU76_000101 [Blyttiomyces sp. JEL0837]|nr:hypothetical protein HDU76_000101 [Blyttiomyces sp. JEL0837]